MGTLGNLSAALTSVGLELVGGDLPAQRCQVRPRHSRHSPCWEKQGGKKAKDQTAGRGGKGAGQGGSRGTLCTFKIARNVVAR